LPIVADIAWPLRMTVAISLRLLAAITLLASAGVFRENARFA
jgi:hypothetical protein